MGFLLDCTSLSFNPHTSLLRKSNIPFQHVQDTEHTLMFLSIVRFELRLFHVHIFAFLPQKIGTISFDSLVVPDEKSCPIQAISDPVSPQCILPFSHWSLWQEWRRSAEGAHFLETAEEKY
jgi:hypothetical protein